MGLFKRKERSMIPEVGGSSSSASSPSKGKQAEPDTEVRDRRYAPRQAPSYAPQQTAGSYGSSSGYGSYDQQQQQSQDGSVPGIYRRVQQQQQHQTQQTSGYGQYGSNINPVSGTENQLQNSNLRSELFAGARAPSSKTGSGFDSYAGVRSLDENQEKEYEQGLEGDQQDQADEEDDEVEAVKQQIRFTKQETLSTARNAIRTAREAETTASNTLGRLGEQTDRMANTELALDKAKGYNSRAADSAKEIKRLNQSIFRPTFEFNKQAKRDAEDQRILARHLEEKSDREDTRKAAYDSRMRVEQGFQEAERSNKFGKKANQATGRAKWEQGGRYQFEASNSDDELEQELDTNLDEIAAITGRLKVLASTAGQEIDAQNKLLDRVGGKVDNLDDKILMNTSYIKRLK